MLGLQVWLRSRQGGGEIVRNPRQLLVRDPIVTVSVHAFPGFKRIPDFGVTPVRGRRIFVRPGQGCCDGIGGSPKISPAIAPGDYSMREELEVERPERRTTGDECRPVSFQAAA